MLDEELELADLFIYRQDQLSIAPCRTPEPRSHREPSFIANALLELLFVLLRHYLLDRIVGAVHENEELFRNIR